MNWCPFPNCTLPEEHDGDHRIGRPARPCGVDPAPSELWKDWGKLHAGKVGSVMAAGLFYADYMRNLLTARLVATQLSFEEYRRLDPYDYPEEFVGEIRRIFRSSEGTDSFHEAMHYGCIGGICRFEGDIHQTQAIAPKLSADEIFWGDYSQGRSAIHCPGMVQLDVPIPVRGHQGLFDWEAWPEVERQLEMEVSA